MHGTGSTGPKSWGTVLDGLAARHTVVMPNLPGSGDSPAEASLDVVAVADRVVETAVAAGLDTFALGGASLGAPIAITAAARHPSRVSRLVSVVGFAKARPTLRLNLELWGAMFARGDADLGKLLVAMSFAEEFLATLTDEQVGQYAALLTTDPAPGTVAQTDLGARLDVRADLGRVAAPTLVVVATGDRCVAPVHSREIADGIPGARLVEVSGGHAARFEDPDRTLSVMLDFLRRDGQ